MVKRIILALCCFFVGTFLALYPQIHSPEIVGFLPYWLITNEMSDFAQHTTSLSYFGLTINTDGTIKKLENPQEEEPGWTNLQKNPDYNGTKSLVVVGADEEVITNIVNNPKTFATNLVNDIAPIMKQYDFTDLNIDIETFREASESSRAGFTTFIQEVKNTMHANNLGTLSLDLIPIALVTDKLFDPKALGAIVDRIILMTYDYHYRGSFTTGSVAPLGGAGQIMEFDVETAIIEALNVIPANKILMGVPLYGYSWETIDNSPGAATIPGGASTASVRRVTELLENCASCSAQFDPIARSPYLIYAEDGYYKQIYYENEMSLQEKINLAKKYKLAGVALWALGYEDDKLLTPLLEYKKYTEIY